MAVNAARDAMRAADLGADDIDGVICAASNLQRRVPRCRCGNPRRPRASTAIAFDMNVACASAAFGIETGTWTHPRRRAAHIDGESQRSAQRISTSAIAIVISYSATSPPLSFIERADERASAAKPGTFSARKLKTKFSNNIRNNFGFLNHCELETGARLRSARPIRITDKLFIQEGRKVFKEVVPIVSELISKTISEIGRRCAGIASNASGCTRRTSP